MPAYKSACKLAYKYLNTDPNINKIIIEGLSLLQSIPPTTAAPNIVQDIVQDMNIKNISKFDNQETVVQFLWDIRMICINLLSVD